MPRSHSPSLKASCRSRNLWTVQKGHGIRVVILIILQMSKKYVNSILRPVENSCGVSRAQQGDTVSMSEDSGATLQILEEARVGGVSILQSWPTQWPSQQSIECQQRQRVWEQGQSESIWTPPRLRVTQGPVLKKHTSAQGADVQRWHQRQAFQPTHHFQLPLQQAYPKRIFDLSIHRITVQQK